MKTLHKVKINMFSIMNAFRDNVQHEPMVSLNNSWELLALVGKIGWRVILACFDTQVKITKRLQLTKNFVGYLLQMRKHHGSTYTVKYLKTCQLALAKRLSNERIQSLNEIEPDLPLPRLTRSSLPRIIPREDRRSILSGNAPSITRFWMTLFSLYKIIRVPGHLKLGTITEPFTGDEKFTLRGAEYLKFLTLRHSSRFNRTVLTRERGLLLLQTSSPSYTTSWMGMFRDVAQLKVLGLDVHIESILKGLNQLKLLAFFQLIKDKQLSEEVHPVLKENKSTSTMGQLATKEEAAGKIRVFAMVDVWTQSCLNPIHEFIFDFLRKLPNDATFDQDAAVQRCITKVEKSKASWGYDLSAATDRLPISLQIAILSPLIGPGLAKSWRDLLVDRTYYLNEPDTEECGGYRYAVGQPMGALSSWGMLAVCHHMIVQLAYQHSIGKGHSIITRTLKENRGTVLKLNYKEDWYENYELLGDDIVIFDERVAIAYLNLMKGFGVGINLKKSVCSSNNSFEFAKVTYARGHIVSAISWKMFISQNNAMGRVAILHHLLTKRVVRHPVNFIKNILRKSQYELGNYPFNLVAFLSMLANSGSISYFEFLQTIKSVENRMSKSVRGLLEGLNLPYLETVITGLVAKTEYIKRTNEMLEVFGYRDLPWHKVEIFRRIFDFKNKIGDKTTYIKELCDEISDFLIPGVMPEELRVIDDRILANPDYNQEKAEHRQLYLVIHAIVADHLGDLAWLEDFGREDIHRPIEELISLNEKCDRLKEALSIVEMAKEKASGATKSRLMVKSPLKAVKFILKSYKHRPQWDFNSSTNTGFLRYFGKIMHRVDEK